MLTKYYHTLIHLKHIQIRYQLWYRIRRYWRKLSRFKYPLSIKKEGYPVDLIPFIPKYISFNKYQFTFLNQSKSFSENNIDWSYKEFGKLWTYNLNYFDFLLQPGIKSEIGQALIDDLISKINTQSTALEPYPIALRCINWIKFISCSSLSNSQILKFSNFLYAQYQILLDNLEYHLLGNHLLEDGFSLLFGAFYFRDAKLYQKAIEIIIPELNEQILNDGGHFELSPMYHQIILDRLLDCINLVEKNNRFEKQESLLSLMQNKAIKMLQWINCMTFSNGQIPLLNDSAPNIAPTTDQLNKYAIRLGILKESTICEIRQNSCNPLINSCNSYLNQSGYRRYNGVNYECIIDIGQIGPSYQAGHAHADTFNFIININNQPFIVDTGISTYEPNTARFLERSTTAHNTVTVNDENSSGVWSSFRVAHLAKVKVLKIEDKKVIAQHYGFQKTRTFHKREWNFSKNKILITDSLTGKISEGKAHFWLGPNITPKQVKQTIAVENIIIKFENVNTIEVIPRQIPNGYNQTLSNYKIEIKFSHNLKTIIKII